MELKRVVVTGVGMVTALGNDVESTWRNVLSGVSGANKITLFDASALKTQFACEAKDFDISYLLDKKEAHKLDRYAQFDLAVADQAIRDARLDLDHEDHDQIGSIFGVGMCGLASYEEEIRDYIQSGATEPHFSPFYIPKSIPNMGVAHVSIRWGLRGPCYSVSSACASSSNAIADACAYIQLGRMKVMLTGGCDADITFCGVGGFNALRALSTRNDDYEHASRPFSLSRDGFVLGEGGACLVLEEYEHAVKRGATIYAELAGIGCNADAYHITAPDPTGRGAIGVMKQAIDMAGVSTNDVDYINAHGTSTHKGDIAEVLAVKELFGEHAYDLNISSTKSMTGHLLGGAGAIEAVFSVLSMRDNVVPPTINHTEGDEDPEIDYHLNFTFNHKQERPVNCVLSNNFGFGGHNVSLLFKRV